MLLPAVVEVEGDRPADVGGALLEQVAPGALNDVPCRRAAVLGRDADRLEGAVIHGQDAAGVDAALDVGGVVDLLRLAEEAHNVADVVDAQVHQGPARLLRVKDRGGLPGAEGVVPAGILAEVALDQLHLPHPRQQLAQLAVIFEVLGGHGLEEEAPLPVGQGGQRRRLGSAGGQRLFDDDVPARLQRRFGVGGVQKVGQGDIDGVHRRQQLFVFGGVEGHAVLRAEGGGLVRAARGAAQGRHLKGPAGGQPGQKLLHDLAAAHDAQFHPAFLLLASSRRPSCRPLRRRLSARRSALCSAPSGG